MVAEGLRLAELLGALSLATDLGMGQPLEQALRSCLIALALGERVGLDGDALCEVYYCALLRFLGCTADAHDMAKMAGGDEIALRAAIAPALGAPPREFAAQVFPQVGAGQRPLRRAGLVAGMITTGQQRAREGLRAHCEMGENLGLLPLLCGVLEAVTIPVLAAGGIGNARALAAVLAAGAAGARCGTRFIASKESAAHSVYVQALIAAGAEDSIRTDRYHIRCPLCPSTHGVLRSAIEAAESLEQEIVGEVRMHDKTFPIARFQGVPPPIKPVTGQIEAMACYAGQSVGDVHGVQPAAEIVAELVEKRPAPAGAAAGLAWPAF